MSSATQVKLLTLLNVSAIKRPRALDAPGGHRGSPSLSRTTSPIVENSPKPNGRASAKSANGEEIGRPTKRRKSVVFGGEVGPSGSTYGKKGKGKGNESANGDNAKGVVNGNGNGYEHEEAVEEEELEGEASDDENEGESSAQDNFISHFGAAPSVLTAEDVSSAEAREWTTIRKTLKGFGRVVELVPGKKGKEASSAEAKNRITPTLLDSLKKSESSPLVSTSLAHLGSYKDFYLHSLDGEADGTESILYGDTKEAMRKAVIVHSLNHVLKTRRRIIRNNEKLAHASSNTAAPDPPRDQSFTRPKVLLLLPLRSLALHYLTSHLFPLAPAGTQIENLKPFTSSFSIPTDVTDPLTTSQSSQFPIDHLVNFRGNSDDNFRFGIKITRKAWRIVMPPANEAKLMDCDIVISSPLGMKMAAEKENSTDLLSSIEICAVDGIDVMQMQNWEHVQFIFENLNKIPDSPHGCDFSRVKPWYLENQAKFLRQTLLLSRYDTPEARAIFHRQCYNLQGKLRNEPTEHPGVLSRVRPGVRQVFERIDVEGNKGLGAEAAVEEVEARFEWFTKKTVPALLKSAVMRENTLIVVPSYFDYVRLTNWLRKTDEVSFAAISEYSSNSEISRARTLFFRGKKSFLIITERFHFYRRYKIRGAKTLVFYALPEHAQFYAEFLETPFLPSQNQKQGSEDVEVDVDEAEISSRVLISRFDLLRLERVVGAADARKMLASSEARFEFV